MASRSSSIIFILPMLAALSPASFVLAAGGSGPNADAAGPNVDATGPNVEAGGTVLRIPGLPPIRMPPTSGVDSDRDDANRLGFDRQFGATLDRDGRDDPVFDHRARRFGDPGSTVIGPGGVIRPGPIPGRQAEAPKKKVLTPAEKADAIRKALMPKPPLAFARRHTLDDLYTKLAAAKDEDEAKGLASLIETIWMRSGSDTANLLMSRAVQAIAAKNYPLSLDLLDQIVSLRPQWAEAWNKRASVRYFNGDLDGSMADVEHVLKLEPQHFGALEGMATILERTHLDKRALEIYRRALAVYPHQPDVQKIVDKLTLQVEGQGI